jgi:hypothetical protein
VIVELLRGTQGKRERKREWQSISNVIKHNICEGGGYEGVYWKLLKKGGGREGGKRAMEGTEQNKIKHIHRADT